jgi:hypothetical protein
MPLVPFDEIFDDDKQTYRLARLTSPEFTRLTRGLPTGDYSMRELYCTDPDCDCEFVQVHFVHWSSFDQTWEERQAMSARYGWPMLGGECVAPVAAVINYYWSRKRPRAYWRPPGHKGGWIGMERIAPDPLGPQIARQMIFRGLLTFYVEEDPAFNANFRHHYMLVKRKVANDRLLSSAMPQPGTKSAF